MPKLIDYRCDKCGQDYEDEFFMDTETPPEELDKKCSKCGGTVKKGDNLKNNCQNWRWNDHGGM